jgi:O-antigen/teichoic acid export membrane protein
VALVVFARVMPKDLFGSAALAITLGYIGIGLGRAAAILPFVVSSGSDELARVNAPRWFLVNLALGALFSTSLLIAAGLIAWRSPDSWLVMACLWGAAIGFCAMHYEFVRRWMIQLRDMRTNLRQVLTFNGLTLTLIGAVALTGNLVLAFASLTVTYLAASAIGLGKAFQVCGTASWRATAGSWAGSWKLTVWTLCEFAADLCLGYGLIVLAASYLGPAGSAVYSATRNLVSPLYAVVSALGTVELPRLARARAEGGAPKLWSAFKIFAAIQAALTIIPAAILVWPSERLMVLAYGEKFGGHGVELLLWLASACVFALSRCLDAWLLATGRSRVLFFCKLAGAATSLALAPLLLPSYGLPGLLSAALAGLCIAGASLLACVWRLRTLA